MMDDRDLPDYPVRICVAGSRSFHDPEKFDILLRAYLSWAGVEPYALISGVAWRGPDKLAIDWALENGIPCFEFPADWDGLGKKAGHVRNGEMRKHLTHLLAFWDGESRGTKEMIEQTEKMGASVTVIYVTPDEEWVEMQQRKALSNAQFSKNRFKAKHYHGPKP